MTDDRLPSVGTQGIKYKSQFFYTCAQTPRAFSTNIVNLRLLHKLYFLPCIYAKWTTLDETDCNKCPIQNIRKCFKQEWRTFAYTENLLNSTEVYINIK